ncbi:TRAP transporter small permease subunit [Candidatus Albibeggiatoa sp. nov. NOAA]|uniref:TRAP transporter small permease subunit n=1 Tax=Candidatus Albibeggiatoa sp. nov. NOAA TaxID=3162724 RepID=UPI0032FA5F18|nr:TRAP transporter small permease subunit [Thiotrichaceae bacterium]
MSDLTEQDYHIPIVHALNQFVRHVGHFVAWINVVLVAVILIQVIMRYGFNKAMVPLEELIWHFYAIGFMFGLSYAITTDSHIRVDIVHMNLPKRLQHFFEIVGILIFLLPFLVIIFHHSLEWVMESYRVGESSTSATGLSNRWIIKSVIPLSFFLMFVAAIARLIQETMLFLHLAKDEDEPNIEISGRVSMVRHLFTVQTNNKGA